MNDADAVVLVEEVERAWNGHDMSRFAACFAQDADFVNVAGVWLQGRDEIEEKHASAHARHFKDSTMQCSLAAFKQIADDVAVLHVRWQLDGHGESGPRRTTDTRHGIWTWTVVEAGDGLRIVAAQNTDVLAGG